MFVGKVLNLSFTKDLRTQDMIFCMHFFWLFYIFFCFMAFVFQYKYTL